jgi:hypothetical protein
MMNRMPISAEMETLRLSSLVVVMSTPSFLVLRFWI